MKSNRFLAGITASVLLMTATFTELPFCNPLPSAAVDTDVSLDTSQISVSSANSLGEMISEEMEAQQKELEESSGNLIREVEMYDNIARVMFTAQESCTVVVGIYSEDEIRMYGCGVMEVDAEQTEIAVPINLDVMPEYYLVKAFLTDTETKAPISPVFYDTIDSEPDDSGDNGDSSDADEDLEPGTEPDDSGDNGDSSGDGSPSDSSGYQDLPVINKVKYVGNANDGYTASPADHFDYPEEQIHVQIESNIDGIPVKKVSFSDCSNLYSISIPSSVESVAIIDCKNLTSINLPSGLRSINFTGCTSLESISIPDSIYEISDYTFNGCEKLKSVTLPLNLKYLGHYVFQGCRALTDIEIPDTIETIQPFCFNGCTALESVTIPKDAPLSKIDTCVFRNCESLKTFTVPSNVTEIGRSAFENCTTLKDIEFSKSVTTISRDAFKNCDALEVVKLPENLTTMETGIFEGCDALHNVIFPPTIHIIPSNTFYNCDKLEEIVIPDTIKKIDACAFRNCDSLKSVTILNPQTGFGENPFLECDKNAITIYGYSGSAAESYAKNNGISFVALDAEDDGEGSDDQAPDDDTPIQPDTPDTPDTPNEDEPEEITPITKTFTGLTPNTIYNFYVTEQVPDSETGEETILYITQGTADENGEWTVSYYPSAETEEEGFVVPFKAGDEGNAEDQTIPGDVNGDGVLDISDAIFLARFVAEDSTLDMSNFNVQNADINGDGLTSAADTVYIIRKIAKLI